MATSLEEAFKKARSKVEAKPDKLTHATVEQQPQAGLSTQQAPTHTHWTEALDGVTPMTHAVDRAPPADLATNQEAESQESAALRNALGLEPVTAAPQPAETKPVSGHRRKPNYYGHDMGPQTIPAKYRAEWEGIRAPVVHTSSYSPPRYPHLQPARQKVAPPPNAVRLHIDPGAAVTWTGRQTDHAPVISRSQALGRRDQASEGKTASTRELVLGFDFGTSSSKVVIGDLGLKQAFAVPFCDAVGIDIFLLPSRLVLEAGCFRLQGTGAATVLNDLKLALMAHPDDLDLQVRVLAYLALTIQHARGWLFHEHAQAYAQTQIVWTFALGLPADQVQSGALTELFSRLALAAWQVAGSADDITPTLCAQTLLRESAEDAEDTEDAEVEIVVMPEIAAQVYGFVSSGSFDAKARNIFLIADVGAGTVDASLFRVIPGRGGRWSFEVYTAAVEPNGVMNLHRERLDWWQQALAHQPAAGGLKEALNALKLPTEFQGRVPEQFTGYMIGVTAEFSGKAIDPDKEFFQRRLVRQVGGRTLYRAYSEQVLPQIDLGDVPFFLCGGGARMGFYQELPEALREFNGFTWLSAKGRELVIPNDLRADGLARADFDRLSVAYGLSMLSLSSVGEAQKIPRLDPAVTGDWRGHYVDKDQM